MGKVLQTVCMVTILVTVTGNMTNAQGKVISMFIQDIGKGESINFNIMITDMMGSCT